MFSVETPLEIRVALPSHFALGKTPIFDQGLRYIFTSI